MDINQKITEELGVKRWQVDAAVQLIDEGNTIPFIARYRKEKHGTLDDGGLESWMRGLPICVIWRRRKSRCFRVLKSRVSLLQSLRHRFRRQRRRLQWMICTGPTGRREEPVQ